MLILSFCLHKSTFATRHPSINDPIVAGSDRNSGCKDPMDGKGIAEIPALGNSPERRIRTMYPGP